MRRPGTSSALAGLAAVATVLLLAGCGGGESGDPGEMVKLVIPAGASEQVDAGESVAGIPDRIEAEVGDTLVVVNQDSSTQFISGFAVSPGQTMRIPLLREGTYLTNCSAHRDRSIRMVVRDPDGTEADGDDSDVAADAELFRSSGCAGCHVLSAADAKGPMGPDLDGRDLSPERIREVVEQGSGAMPAFAERLSDEEIDRLAGFVSAASRP